MDVVEGLDAPDEKEAKVALHVVEDLVVPGEEEATDVSPDAAG